MATVSPVSAAEVGGDDAAASDLIDGPSRPTQTTASQQTKELASRASEYILQEKFKRSFKVPATESHSELSVTYAVGGRDNVDAPTMLLIGGLMGGRYMASLADYLGEQHGMRIVVIDRPGLGDSTPVEPALRLSVWLETIPVLMRTINAEHVSLAAHSNGVIYALNTIYYMPWVLPPSNRKLYLLSPWVPPDHSGMTLLSIASYLPSALISTVDSLVRFANSTVVPTVQFSGVVAGAISSPFTKFRKDNSAKDQAHLQKHERDDLCRKYRGVSAAEVAARSQQIMKCLLSESVTGSSQEALLCLKKDATGSWGPCDDYKSYSDVLELKLQEYFQEVERGEGSSSHPSTAKDPAHSTPNNGFGLKVFWAEKDGMVGKQGEEYFDQCFQRFVRSEISSSQNQSCLSYESEVVPDTDHDATCLPEYGALPKILEDIKRDNTG